MNPSVFSHKTDTNALYTLRAHQILPRVTFSFSPNFKIRSKEHVFSQLEITTKKKKAEGFIRRFEGWKDRTGRCVATDENYFERDAM
jgi:hypothetical protein